jgi:hypothetical protein
LLDSERDKCLTVRNGNKFKTENFSEVAGQGENYKYGQGRLLREERIFKTWIETP